MPKSVELIGKKALVTGGGQGIGLAISQRLAADGASVVIADKDVQSAMEQADLLKEEGYKVNGIALDVTDMKNIISACETLGAIDILVNNAGIIMGTKILDALDSDMRKVMEVNLFGAVNCIKAFAPDMVRSSWGRIVNMGSMMGHTAFCNDFAYVVSKTGLAGLTRSVAADLAKYGITVNTICPGNILTNMMRDLAPVVEKRDGLAPGSFLKNRASSIPAKRLGNPEDVAALVAFVCREDANYLTGQNLHVNGGLYYN